MLFVGIFKCFSVLDTKIAFVDVADLIELINNGFEYRIVFDYYIYIYTRLCGKSFY